MLQERDALLDELHFNLIKAQQVMAKAADSKRREVELAVGKMAYRLELPNITKIHHVFHISQLKKFIGQANVSTVLPPQLTAELELVVEPEELLEVRQVKEGGTTTLEALIQWKGLPIEEAIWEDISIISHQFPDFHLEDKERKGKNGKTVITSLDNLSEVSYTVKGQNRETAEG
ncbi:hypothetical protein AgCh_021450 [Apium graveolens]